MQRLSITVPGTYELDRLEFPYNKLCLFSMKNRVDMSDDDFDYDAHIDDLWFYKGLLAYHTDTATTDIYYFEQKRVFELSKSCGNAAVLFYAACTEDYSKVFFYKKDLIKGNSRLVHTLDTLLLDMEPLTSPLSPSNFYTLNERYALISYIVPGREVRYERYDALLDSLTGELVYFTVNEMMRYMEYIQPYHDSGQNYLWIKTGEHMVDERKMDWVKKEVDPEDIVLIEVEKFIAMALCNQFDFAPFVLHSSLPHEALADYMTVDGKIILLIEQFDSGNSVLITRDIRQGTVDFSAQSRLYDRIYYRKEKLYAREAKGRSHILYDLQTHTPICEIAEPQHIIALSEQGVLTTNLHLGHEDHKIYLHTNRGVTVFAEGRYFIDYEQDMILLIHEEEK